MDLALKRMKNWFLGRLARGTINIKNPNGFTEIGQILIFGGKLL
jgi:hypothetical protein